MKNKLQINDIVLSSSFGLGKIMGFEVMDGSDTEFVVIESLEKKIKMMSPLTKSVNFRKLTESSILLDKLEELKSYKETKEFDSKKDRITYFKARVNLQDIDSVFETVSELHVLKDRGSVEIKIYTGLIESIKLELTIVLEIDAKAAEEMIESNLPLIQ